jgi:hypothetical protein
MGKYKNLYVNGCSFTAGHHLSDTDTWPHLLSNELNADTFINDAKNGNSLDTIIDITFFNLLKLDPNDTLIVLGLTWTPRIGIVYNNLMVNQTPADFGPTRSIRDSRELKTDFRDKLSTYKRASFLPSEFYEKDTINEKNLNNTEYTNDILQNGFNDVLAKYSIYMKSKIEFDVNFGQNLLIKYLKSIILIQNYLENNNFNYYFINFPNRSELWDNSYLNNLYDNINSDKIIDLSDIHIDDPHGHPSSKGCNWAVDKIMKKIKTDETPN